MQQKITKMSNPPSSLIPPPTRRCAVIHFDELTTVFFNREVDVSNNDDPNPRRSWQVHRTYASAISSRRVESENVTKWAYQLTFYGAGGQQSVGQVKIHVPKRWLPRTILVAIDHWMSYNYESVISIVQSYDGAVDILGILRDTSGEDVRDTHDLLFYSDSDYYVRGGGHLNDVDYESYDEDYWW